MSRSPQRRSHEAMGVIRRALARGYRVKENGQVVGTSGKVLRPKTNRSTATPSVQISVRDPRLGHRQVKVSQLAAYQWFGEATFASGVEVRHLNGDGLDNSRCNLALGSAHDNQMDMSVGARNKRANSGAFVGRSLSLMEVRRLRRDRERGRKLKELAAKYGVSKTTVSCIVRGQYYPDVGVLVLPPLLPTRTKHGRGRMYVRGCRCEKCLKWKSDDSYIRRKRGRNDNGSIRRSQR